jgi:hypothetical protein
VLRVLFHGTVHAARDGGERRGAVEPIDGLETIKIKQPTLLRGGKPDEKRSYSGR